MTNDLEIALSMADHIIHPCCDPREDPKVYNLRDHHLRLAAEISAVMEDGPAKDFLDSVIAIYQHEKS